jgi:hypothetical protein
MARTADPNAATKKAWLTRKRNAEAAAGIHVLAQEGGGGTAVQQRGDFAISAVRAHLESEVRALGARNALVAGLAGLVREDKWHPPEAADLANARPILDEATRALRLPDSAVDGLSAIVLSQSRDMARRPNGDSAPAQYEGQGPEKMIRVDARRAVSGQPDPAAGAAKLLSHEIGHHVHLSKLTPEAAEEWARISKNGQNCEVSKYGRQNTTEHFAEAFSHYARPDEAMIGGYAIKSRAWLKDLEPKAFAFMERLWRDKTMWQPNGQSEYYPERRGNL